MEPWRVAVDTSKRDVQVDKQKSMMHPVPVLRQRRRHHCQIDNFSSSSSLYSTFSPMDGPLFTRPPIKKAPLLNFSWDSSFY